EERLKAAERRAGAMRQARQVYAEAEAWTRVPLADYERNLTAMIAFARRQGAGVVLLFNELWWEENPYRAAIQRVAAAAPVPWVDSARLIARARHEVESDLERRHGLTPGPAAMRTRAGEGVEVIFRVAANRQAAPAGVFIVGTHPALGALVPNRVAMYDDGTHGDQRAGDGVWSYTASLAPGQRLAYVYTTSGRAGRRAGIVSPVDLRRASCTASISTTRGASPSDGSSSSSSDGFPMRVRAIVSICCSPPERRPAIRPRSEARCGNSSKTRSAVHAMPPPSP